MSSSDDINSLSSVSSNKSRVIALETTLQQSLVYFKELLLDIEELHSKIDDYRSQLLAQKERCDSEKCHGSEILKKVIESKDNIIQLVASSLTKLNETKDLNLINDIFKILFGDSTSEKPTGKTKDSNCDVRRKMLSPKKEVNECKSDELNSKDMSITEDILSNESVSEIDVTPQGRVSPIIQSRRLRSSILAKSSVSSDSRDKKKCPNNWTTPEHKSVKLTFPTPTNSKSAVRLRQSRINLVKLTQSCVVDLTSSPEFSGGVRSSRSDTHEQPIVKKEYVESDDTILPSPTSGPVNFTLLKSTLKDSPCKFKKPSLCLKSKTDRDIKVEPSEIKQDVTNIEETENSLIFDPMSKRSTTSKKKFTIKTEQPDDVHLTPCDINESISLLKVNLAQISAGITRKTSPQKRPLEENINFANVPMETDMESSISVLRPEINMNVPDIDPATGDNKNAVKDNDNAKRKTPELVEPVYKEPTVRNKAEKRALKGWSCDECKNFFGELYKNDPVMLAKKIEECSKHRGRNNPIRPKTPPGFWNPRWQVPDDTEEFNRMNNAH